MTQQNSTTENEKKKKKDPSAMTWPPALAPSGRKRDSRIGVGCSSPNEGLYLWSKYDWKTKINYDVYLHNY